LTKIKAAKLSLFYPISNKKNDKLNLVNLLILDGHGT